MNTSGNASTQLKQDLSSPRVTVITINYNDLTGLKATIESVIHQKYSDFEYLIIDGESTDGSVHLINEYDQNFFKVLVEKDKGIYHAMNKAISIAKGEWLIFMNSGDIFADYSSLELAMQDIKKDDDVIYADWIYANSGKCIKASKNKMSIRHQSVIYKKNLHDIYGTYVVSPGVTISDYIFFSSITQALWRYHNRPLSICEETGVSSHIAHFYQRIAVDFIFGRYNVLSLVIIFLLYPSYSFIKKIFVSRGIFSRQRKSNKF
jgi:glycosyltransferase involved in cell wall biosynthesis